MTTPTKREPLTLGAIEIRIQELCDRLGRSQDVPPGVMAMLLRGLADWYDPVARYTPTPEHVGPDLTLHIRNLH